MPVISSILLVISLLLAGLIGPQTRPWSWGPGVLSLAIATLAALPAFWKRTWTSVDFGLLGLGTLTAGWFAWRASISPVAELGQADLLLIMSAVATFVCIRGIEGHQAAERVIIYGVALLLLANLIAIGMQVSDPEFTPLFRFRGSKWPTGFYGHYNDAANFLIASSMLLGAAAIFGRYRNATRFLWGLMALAGLAAVFLTRSRGGVLGAAVASGVLAAMALTIGKRRNVKWFAPALIAAPLIALLLGGTLILAWTKIQNIRFAGTGIFQMMDNDVRLYLLGIAMGCIGMHPWTGGGSRSFSWECYGQWDPKVLGVLPNRPEQVHNEVVQAATDYGLIGGGLIVGLLATLVIIAIIRSIFSENRTELNSGDCWRLGALAGLIGMMVQSCFSFVFHLLPGIILLGICLGLLSRSSGSRGGLAPAAACKIVFSAAALACCLILIPFGWKATRVMNSLWPVYLSKQGMASAEERISRLTDAINVWPGFSFYKDRAANYQTLAADGVGKESTQLLEAAAADYQEASLLHPYDPGSVVNCANVLSKLQRDAEAEAAYAKAIDLQGGMEAAFQAQLSTATHYLQKGLREFSEEAPNPSLRSLEIAAEQVEDAFQANPNYDAVTRDKRVSIHESLGAAREAAGNRDGAFESYAYAATLPGGDRAKHRTGMLYGKMAAEAWAARYPSEALGYFLKAQTSILAAGGHLPSGVSVISREEYLSYLQQTISFLRGAKIEPPPEQK